MSVESHSFWYLENLDMKGIFCPDKMKDQSDHLPVSKVKKGAYVYMQDDSADKIYFITEGRIKIGTISNSGKEITKAILSDGEVFGELSLAGVEKRRDYALAIEDTIMCILTRADMKIMLKDHTPLNTFFMNLIGSRALEMERRLESLVFKDSRTRVIEFLLDLAKKKGRPVGYETLVRRFMTHQEIANLTATSRQTVTTILNELRNQNILTFNRRRLLIRDLDKLAAAM
ncbi:MAG: Crp/Fnr family transcriptional regulator [Bacteroidia bacterium]|nr:Crp/Fnr family transcriptional regulator [Bacteroidia bacterium]